MEQDFLADTQYSQQVEEFSNNLMEDQCQVQQIGLVAF